MEYTKSDVEYVADVYKPSFYKDDNGQKFDIIKRLENNKLLDSFDVHVFNDFDYDELGEEIGATKAGTYYERSEILKRLRELGYDAIAITVDTAGEYSIYSPCKDDYKSYDVDEYEGILYSASGADLKKFIEVHNMNERNEFVRILTDDWKVSRIIPWIIDTSWMDEEEDESGMETKNVGLSSYTIQELNKLGIKIQNSYEIIPLAEE